MKPYRPITVAAASGRVVSGMCGVDDADAAVGAVARLRLDHDLDNLTQRGQEAHQALAGKVGEPAGEQSRDLRLVDPHERSGGHLGQAAPPDDVPDMARKAAPRKVFGHSVFELLGNGPERIFIGESEPPHEHLPHRA